MTAKLPPLPEPTRPHDGPMAYFELHTGGYTREQMRAYGALCAAQATEDAAKVCVTNVDLQHIGGTPYLDYTVKLCQALAKAIRARGTE